MVHITFHSKVIGITRQSLETDRLGTNAFLTWVSLFDPLYTTSNLPFHYISSKNHSNRKNTMHFQSSNNLSLFVTLCMTWLLVTHGQSAGPRRNNNQSDDGQLFENGHPVWAKREPKALSNGMQQGPGYLEWVRRVSWQGYRGRGEFKLSHWSSFF